jgi:flagellar basal body rod protein FlgG
MEINGGNGILNVYQSAQKIRQTANEQATQAANRLASGQINTANMVQLNESTHLYKLNSQLVKVADQMTGTVLNLRA